MQAMDVRILTDRQLRSEIETLRKTLIMTKEFLWDEGEEIKNILGGLAREQSRRLSKFMQTERGPLYGQPPPPPRPPPRQYLGAPAPPPPPSKPYQPKYSPKRESWGSASSPRSSSSSLEESLASFSNDVVVHDSAKVGSKPSSSRGAGNPASECGDRGEESPTVTRARLLAERLDDVLSTVSDGLSPHERDVIIRSLTERGGDGVKYDAPPAPEHCSKAQQAYRTHPDAPTWDQIPHNSQAFHVDVQREHQDWEWGHHQGGYQSEHFQNWRFNGPPPPPPPGPPPPPPPGPPPGPPPPPPPGPPPGPPPRNLQMSPMRQDDHFSCGPSSGLEGEITPVASEGPDFMYSDGNDFYAEWEDENSHPTAQPVAHQHKPGNEHHVLELDTAMRATFNAERSTLNSPLHHPMISAVRGAGGASNSMKTEQYLDSMLYKSSLSSNSGLCAPWAMTSAPAAHDMSTTDSWWGSRMGNSSQKKNPGQSTTPTDMRIDDTADMQFVVNSRYSSETDLAYSSPTKDDSSKAEGAALKSFKLLPQTLTNFFRNRSNRRKAAV